MPSSVTLYPHLDLFFRPFSARLLRPTERPSSLCAPAGTRADSNDALSNPSGKCETSRGRKEKSHLFEVLETFGTVDLSTARPRTGPSPGLGRPMDGANTNCSVRSTYLCSRSVRVVCPAGGVDGSLQGLRLLIGVPESCMAPALQEAKAKKRKRRICLTATTSYGTSAVVCA